MSEKQSKIMTTFLKIKTKQKEKITNRNYLFFKYFTFLVLYYFCFYI